MHMRTRHTISLLALVAIASPARAFAQDVGDFAAYAALILTSVGAFVPLAPVTSAASGSAFVIRYGNLDPGGSGGSLHNFSLGGDMATQHGRFGFTLGGSDCDGCKGNIMAGIDYTALLTQDVLSIGLRPALGFSKPLGEGAGTALSLGLSLPVGAKLGGVTGPVFVPYIVPGFGFGRVSDDEEDVDSESGTRPMLGGGFSIAGRQSSFALHVGFQKVFVEDGDMSIGFGMSFGRRATSAP
jgi:hypothetical protein